MYPAVIGLLVGCFFGFVVRFSGFAVIATAILVVFGITQFSAATSVWSFCWMMLVMLLALQIGYLLGATSYTLFVHFSGIFGRRYRPDERKEYAGLKGLPGGAATTGATTLASDSATRPQNRPTSH